MPVLSLLGRAVYGTAKLLRLAFRPVRRSVRLFWHLLRYEPPGELQHCPACGGAVRHLAPLGSNRRTWTYGFISGCVRCGILFANPLPSSEELEATYSADGRWGRHRQDEQEKQVSRRRLEALFAPVAAELDVLHPPAGATVLDIGCGLGGMLDALAAQGWTTYGIDPATKVAFARHRELQSIPAEPRFDLAVLHHVLEHVTDPLAILRSLGSAVRQGGFLLISVPNLDDVAEHGELKYCIRSEVHVLAYSTAALTWLAAEAGFRVVHSGRGPGNPRQRVVLARREDGLLTRPTAALASARAALASYEAAHPDAVAGPRHLPVRMRAAYLDLEHSEWRLTRNASEPPSSRAR
ncbi:MAG: class I SAM-dependent methyltransferase [Vicinamibacterales bacterium]